MAVLLVLAGRRIGRGGNMAEWLDWAIMAGEARWASRRMIAMVAKVEEW